MKKILMALIATVLLLVSFHVWPASYEAETKGSAVSNVKQITRDFKFSSLNVYKDRIITTSDSNVISSYSKTGSLNWEKSVEGPVSIGEERFATVDKDHLFIHSTASGEVVKTVSFPKSFYGGLIAKLSIDEKYILVTGKSSSSKILLYDLTGKLLLDSYAEGVKEAVLYKDAVLFKNSKGIHSISLSTRKKLWDAPLDSPMITRVELTPVDNVIYVQGIEKNATVLQAINASTGAALYKKTFGQYEETAIHVKDFGLITYHYIEDIHNFYHSNGSVKMALSLESSELKQYKKKYYVTGIYYNSTQNMYASEDFLYYFKTYAGVDDNYIFSTIQLREKAGKVKFEKIIEEYVYGLAMTDTNRLFVSNGLGEYEESNKLSVYDASGVLLDTIETEYMPRLKADDAQVYGYGSNTLYIFTENKPKAPAPPTINPIGDNSTVVTGKAEIGTKVYLYVGSKKLGEVLAKNGTYSMKIAKQKAGTSIAIYAVDAAENKSPNKIIKVIDKTAPPIPSVNTVSDKATTITGKAESGAKVYAYVGKTKLGEGAAKKGAYSIKIAKQKAGTSISVYAIDSAKNKSGSKTVKVIDKTAPTAPTVNKVTSKATTVSGKGEKAATVLIYNGSKKIGQGIVDSKGNFKVKIKAQKKGSTLKLYVQDKAGNKSSSKAIKVN